MKYTGTNHWIIQNKVKEYKKNLTVYLLDANDGVIRTMSYDDEIHLDLTQLDLSRFRTISILDASLNEIYRSSVGVFNDSISWTKLTCHVGNIVDFRKLI